MKIINEAQNKHESYFYQNMKFIFIKNKLLGICMIYLKLTICIHIPNMKRVYDIVCMEARDSRGIHVYLLILNNNSIYMKQNMKIGKNKCT